MIIDFLYFFWYNYIVFVFYLLFLCGSMGMYLYCSWIVGNDYYVLLGNYCLFGYFYIFLIFLVLYCDYGIGCVGFW